MVELTTISSFPDHWCHAEPTLDTNIKNREIHNDHLSTPWRSVGLWFGGKIKIFFKIVGSEKLLIWISRNLYCFHHSIPLFYVISKRNRMVELTTISIFPDHWCHAELARSPNSIDNGWADWADWILQSNRNQDPKFSDSKFCNFENCYCRFSGAFHTEDDSPDHLNPSVRVPQRV